VPGNRGDGGKLAVARGAFGVEIAAECGELARGCGFLFVRLALPVCGFLLLRFGGVLRGPLRRGLAERRFAFFLLAPLGGLAGVLGRLFGRRARGLDALPLATDFARHRLCGERAIGRETVAIPKTQPAIRLAGKGDEREAIRRKPRLAGGRDDFDHLRGTARGIDAAETLDRGRQQYAEPADREHRGRGLPAPWPERNGPERATDGAAGQIDKCKGGGPRHDVLEPEGDAQI